MASFEQISQRVSEKKYKARVAIRKAKYIFKHRKEIYKKITDKLDKKAYGVSTSMAIVAGQVLTPLNTGITLAGNEILKNNENVAIGLYILGLTTILSNIKSFQIEKQSLVEKKYSNSPVTTLLFRYLDKKNLKAFKLLEKMNNTELAAIIAATFSHGYHFLFLGLFNPANIKAVYDFVKGDPAARLVIVGLLTVASTNAFWNIWSEKQILNGNDEKVIASIKKIQRKAGDFIFGNPARNFRLD